MYLFIYCKSNVIIPFSLEILHLNFLLWKGMGYIWIILKRQELLFKEKRGIFNFLSIIFNIWVLCMLSCRFPLRSLKSNTCWFFIQCIILLDFLTKWKWGKTRLNVFISWVITQIWNYEHWKANHGKYYMRNMEFIKCYFLSPSTLNYSFTIIHSKEYLPQLGTDQMCWITIFITTISHRVITSFEWTMGCI